MALRVPRKELGFAPPPHHGSGNGDHLVKLEASVQDQICKLMGVERRKLESQNAGAWLMGVWWKTQRGGPDGT